MAMWRVLRRRVRGPRHPDAVRAREGAEVVVERVVLFDDDDHVIDLAHGNRSPRDRSSSKARKGLRPSNPTRLSRLRNRQVENLLIPRVHGLRGAKEMPQAVIVGAVRTPIGKRAGSLKDWRPDDLAAFVLRALADRTGIEPKIVEDVVLGCVTQVDEQGLNIARLAPLIAGFPESVPGTSVNRMCASGLQAFNFAAMEVMTGQNDVVIAGGVEVMSRVPLGSDAGALSPKLLEKYEIVQQGISADLVADKYKITREQMDEFSLWSHRKAIRAIDEGRFKKEIEPVPVFDEGGNKRMFDTDEHPRRTTSLEKLASLAAAFKPDGRITAGNSSGINDGACGILVTTPDKARELKLEPRARFVSTGVAGTNPTIMLDGTIPAIRKALARADLKADDIDIWEVNEAFASVPIATRDTIGVDRASTGAQLNHTLIDDEAVDRIHRQDDRVPGKPKRGQCTGGPERIREPQCPGCGARALDRQRDPVVPVDPLSKQAGDEEDLVVNGFPKPRLHVSGRDLLIGRRDRGRQLGLGAVHVELRERQFPGTRVHVAPLKARLRLVQRLAHRRGGTWSRGALARPELHVRRGVAHLLGLVAQVRPDDRLRVRIPVEELGVDERVVRARGPEWAPPECHQGESEAARTLVARRVFEGDSLMDDGPAGLRERDPARLEAHRLNRVLAVSSVQKPGPPGPGVGVERARQERS